MAAASSKIVVRGLFAANLASTISIPLFSVSRASHWSAYEKNPEEQISPRAIPDHMIHPSSENYWAPHPQTGVFGPPAHHSPVLNDASAPGGEGSVLDVKVWFRHNGLEDPEKPHFLESPSL